MSGPRRSPSSAGGRGGEAAGGERRFGGGAGFDAGGPFAGLGLERHEIACGDGARLSVRVVSQPAPRVLAICGHAMMVDRRTLSMDRSGQGGLVGALARRGVACVWPDLRGHGESGPRAERGGAWDYEDLASGDTPALIAFARARFPRLPVAAVGHSLFGHVALAHAARHDGAGLSSLAMVAANVWLPSCEPSAWRWAEKRALIEVMWLLTRACGRFPAHALRVGTCDEALPYVRDFVRWVRRGDWTARDGTSHRARLPSLRVPVLALSAAGDRLLARPECVARLLAPVPQLTHVVAGTPAAIEAATKRVDAGPPVEPLVLPFDPGHMALVTDARSRPAWDRLADFLLANAAN